MANTSDTNVKKLCQKYVISVMSAIVAETVSQQGMETLLSLGDMVMVLGARDQPEMLW